MREQLSRSTIALILFFIPYFARGGRGRGGRGSVRRGWQYGRFTPGLRPRVASLERGENLENLTILLQGSTKYVLTAWHETKWGRSSPAWWGMNTSFHPPTVCYLVLRVYFYRRLPRQRDVLFLSHASRVYYTF